jgi:hypothetical protein
MTLVLFSLLNTFHITVFKQLYLSVFTLEQHVSATLGHHQVLNAIVAKTVSSKVRTVAILAL